MRIRSFLVRGQKRTVLTLLLGDTVDKNVTPVNVRLEGKRRERAVVAKRYEGVGYRKT